MGSQGTNGVLKTFITGVIRDLRNNDVVLLFNSRQLEAVKNRLDFDEKIEIVHKNGDFIKIRLEK